FASVFSWGILQIVLGDAWILTPLQAFIEYFIAFAFVGFAGLFMNQIKRNLLENNKAKANFISLSLLFSVPLLDIFGTLLQEWSFLVSMLSKKVKAQLSSLQLLMELLL